MNINTEINTIKNNEYLSIENLKILIQNLKGYFNERYGENLDYDKLDLNKLFFENMIDIIIFRLILSVIFGLKYITLKLQKISCVLFQNEGRY